MFLQIHQKKTWAHKLGHQVKSVNTVSQFPSQSTSVNLHMDCIICDIRERHIKSV